MKRSKELREKSEDLEKLAIVFSKYEVLFNPSHYKSKSLQVKLAQAKAYKELVRELNLPDISTLKAQIQRLKTFSYCKMRHCVSRSENQGLHGHRDALKYAPEWLKKLDEPWNLFEKAFKAESPRRAPPVVRELLRCAERAAARARCPLAAARALSAPASFQPLARAMRLDLARVHGIWTRYYDQAVHKLMALINVGDCSERLDTLKRFTLQDWRVIDVSLLYDVRLRIVREQYFYNAVTLYPMILLFKLMIAAKEKIDQRNAAKLKSNESHTGCQKEKSGARTETEGSSTDNNKETNVTSPCRKDSDNNVSTSQAQHTSELNEDELSTHKEKLEKKARNEYETAEIWALVHSKYTNCFLIDVVCRSGRSASAVLLQKRWYEIKQQTRALLCGATPVPLLLAMGKRFPFILTETLPSWKELVGTDQVFLDCDLESYKFELFNTDLEVPDIDENILFDEINDWSDDEVEIINENREVITVSDSDDEQINVTNRKPNIADLPSDNHIDREETSLEIDKITTRIEESDISIKTIESLDPTSAKVKIIFEDDSDYDVNEYLNCPEDIKNITLALNSDVHNIKAHYSQETEQNTSNNTRTKDKGAGPSSECEISNIISNDKIETKTVKDEKLNYLLNTIPTDELNTASHKDNITIKTETIDKLDDTDTQSEAIVENNDTIIKNEKTVENDLLIDDISDSHVEDTGRVNDVTSLIVKESEEDEIESLDGSVKCEIDDDDSTFVDEKLLKLSQVVLTPLEEIDVWRKLSKFDTINCRRFSVRNFSKVINVTSKQLAKCRPYVPPHRASRNGISRQKNLELNQMAKSLKHKRRFLTKRLKLPRTYFSLEFWNERNVGLLESCKPVLVRLERVSRVVKKVELANIDEVRRINRTILTAQVAPITVGSNRTIVIDSTKLQAPISESQVQPTNISINNQESTDVTTKTPAYYVNLPSETEVKEMIKKIVRRGGLAKLPDPVIVLPAKNDIDFGNKQRRLDRDIREMSTRLLKQHERKGNRKKETKQSLFKKELKLDPNINCSQEWQRQKSQNLIYFNLRPKADETDQKEIQTQTNKNVKKKRKKPKKPKEKTEEIIKKEASVIQSENFNVIIKLKDETVSDVTNVTKDLENNFSTVTCVSSRKSSESDSEMGRLVINLDTTTDQDLKRKSLDTPPDTLCKITKVESKADIETETTSTIASDCVIDLCDDSNDELEINALANVPRDGIKVHDQETQNNESVPQIKIKIVQNTIEINGDCDSKVPEDKNGEILTFLSKVAGRIQAKNKTAVSTPTPLTNNSTVYYVIKSVDKDQQSNETTDLKTPNANTETSCNRNTNIQPLNVNTDVPNDANVSIPANSSSLYYVVKIPDLQGGGTSVITESLSPPMPIIQSVSSLNQIPQRNQKFTFPPNLRTYPQNLGDEIDINYETHMSSTSMPMRRNNSVPMPITSVTALPSQNDSKTESSNMPWPNTNHPATMASQKIYPVTVTSGNSRSETAKEEIEGGIQVIPIWNVPETNFMPKVAPKLATSTQANDLFSVMKQAKTSPLKRVYGASKKRAPINADKPLSDEVCIVKEEFPLDIVENGVGLPSSNAAPPDNSLKLSNVIKRTASDDESNFDYIVKLKPSKNNPINLGQSSCQDNAEPSMLTIIREKKRKTGCERVRAFRARQRALKALADRNKKIIIAKTSTERSRAFRARQKAKQSVDGSQTTNKTSTDESDNDAINKPLQDENILKSPSENSLNINHNEMINKSSSESEDVKTEITDQETSSYLSDASNDVSVKDEPIFYGSE